MGLEIGGDAKFETESDPLLPLSFFSSLWNAILTPFSSSFLTATATRSVLQTQVQVNKRRLTW